MTFGYTNSAEWEPAKIWCTFSGSSRCLHSSGRKGVKPNTGREPSRHHHQRAVSLADWGRKEGNAPGNISAYFHPLFYANLIKQETNYFKGLQFKCLDLKCSVLLVVLPSPNIRAAQRVKILAKSAGCWAWVRRWGKAQLGPVEHHLCGDASFKGPFFYLL